MAWELCFHCPSRLLLATLPGCGLLLSQAEAVMWLCRLRWQHMAGLQMWQGRAMTWPG